MKKIISLAVGLSVLLPFVASASSFVTFSGHYTLQNESDVLTVEANGVTLATYRSESRVVPVAGGEYNAIVVIKDVDYSVDVNTEELTTPIRVFVEKDGVKAQVR